MAETSAGKSRFVWVDYVKGICMFTVIFNHLHVPDIYYRFTYPFELVGFFGPGFTPFTRQSQRLIVMAKKPA